MHVRRKRPAHGERRGSRSRQQRLSETAQSETEPTALFPDGLVVMAVKNVPVGFGGCDLQPSFPASVLPEPQNGLSGFSPAKPATVCSGTTSGPQTKTMLMKH